MINEKLIQRLRDFEEWAKDGKVDIARSLYKP
jgi:hypothetical protein